MLAALVRRLDPGAAKDLVSQLPSLLHASLRRVSPGPDKSVARESIVTELVARLGMDAQAAGEALRAVGAAGSESVAGGQRDDVRGQLSPDVRAAFELLQPLDG